MADTELLEARLADLADVVGRLERRIEALERGAQPGRRSAAQAALDRSARPAPPPTPAFLDAGQATRLLSLGGRSFLVLAGAFVLRAVTDAGTVPAWMGVAAGFLYAGVWMVMADRAGKAGLPLSAAFHAVSVVVIGFPLLVEATNRFKLFSPGGAALALTALTGAALLLAARRSLPSLAWVVALGGTVTALWLMATSKALVPGALYVVLLSIALLWIGYVRDWTSIRWPVAIAADLVVLLVALRAGDRATNEGPASALLVQTVLVALFMGSVGARTILRGRKVVPFEVIQSVAVIAVGIGGAVWVAVRSGMGQAGFGLVSLVLGAASYAVAFSFLRRQPVIRENFRFYGSVAVVFVLAGTALLLGEPARSVAWAVLAVAIAWASPRHESRTLAAHAGVYALAAALASGLLVRSAGALLFGSAVSWRPGLGAVAALVGAAGATWLTGKLERASVLERILPTLLDLTVAVGLAGVATAWLAPVVAGTGDGASPGALATLRTVALVAVAVGAAWLGRRPRLAEAAWLAYPILGLTGLKMLLEDLKHGRPATLILAFACYGLALILVPRLRARGQGAVTPAAPS
ncbi:MAG TPA: hypothetical protein VFM45_09410 [Anaeromyxobacteraceae bacterium]|nr:hypothetical protein [Anaeromyxobacteraceae bacterium]